MEIFNTIIFQFLYIIRRCFILRV